MFFQKMQKTHEVFEKNAKYSKNSRVFWKKRKKNEFFFKNCKKLTSFFQKMKKRRCFFKKCKKLTSFLQKHKKHRVFFKKCKKLTSFLQKTQKPRVFFKNIKKLTSFFQKTKKSQKTHEVFAKNTKSSKNSRVFCKNAKNPEKKGGAQKRGGMYPNAMFWHLFGARPRLAALPGIVLIFWFSNFELFCISNFSFSKFDPTIVRAPTFNADWQNLVQIPPKLTGQTPKMKRLFWCGPKVVGGWLVPNYI